MKRLIAPMRLSAITFRVGVCGLGILSLGGRTELPPGGVPIGDRKAIHSGFCKPINSSVELDYLHGGITYTGNSVELVTCPVVRDATGGTADLNHIEIELVSATGDNDCWAYTMREDTSGPIVLDSVQTHGSNVGLQQHNYYLMSTSGSNEGAYWVECFLGRFDKLRHIYVNDG